MSIEMFCTDTETASLEGGVCDIAIARLDENLNVTWSVESLIDPERPISPGASGIHHITDEMVVDQPTLSEFMDLQGHPFKVDNPVVAGHNVQFDVRMIGSHIPQVHTRLCTLKLARAVWPDAPDHKLQTLRYMLKLDAGTAHRAMGDVIACINLMRQACDKLGVGVQGLLDVVKKPMSLSSKLTFGKHKGMALGDLPMNYVRWLLDKADSLDPEIREALTTRLK